jgi:TPR repeat protein
MFMRAIRRACDGGEMAGCTSLGWLYHNGHGVPRDYARARGLFERACDGGEMTGCRNLGVLYDNGHGVPRDYARARELYDRAPQMFRMMDMATV